MYVRPPSYRYQAPMRVPENYSGNIFREAPKSEVREKAEDAPIVAEEVVSKEESTSGEATPALLGWRSFRLRLPSIFGREGGIGGEELLILALILLLSDAGDGEGFDDLIFFLILLFFIK